MYLVVCNNLTASLETSLPTDSKSSAKENKTQIIVFFTLSSTLCFTWTVQVFQQNLFHKRQLHTNSCTTKRNIIINVRIYTSTNDSPITKNAICHPSSTYCFTFKPKLSLNPIQMVRISRLMHSPGRHIQRGVSVAEPPLQVRPSPSFLLSRCCRSHACT